MDQNFRMELLKMLFGDVKIFEKPSSSFEKPKKQIVIAQRGWVFLGDVEKEKENFVIKNASVIRVWGTTKGLGEIAKCGPIEGKTILDPCPDVTIHEFSIVARIDCVY